MAHYFEIKTDRAIRDEFRKVRKNKYNMLLPIARKIANGNYEAIDLEFFIDGHPVDANAFAGEVLRMEDARVAKQNKETKLIWIQQGARLFLGTQNASNLGLRKRPRGTT
jgi:hypothetical protein